MLRVCRSQHSVSQFKPTELFATGVDFGTVTGGTAVQAPDKPGFKFVAWLGIAPIGKVVSMYLEWPTAARTKLWIPAGGSYHAYGFALYQSI